MLSQFTLAITRHKHKHKHKKKEQFPFSYAYAYAYVTTVHTCAFLCLCLCLCHKCEPALSVLTLSYIYVDMKKLSRTLHQEVYLFRTSEMSLHNHIVCWCTYFVICKRKKSNYCFLFFCLLSVGLQMGFLMFVLILVSQMRARLHNAVMNQREQGEERKIEIKESL